MRNLAFILLILISFQLRSQSYNIVPCPNFECAEYWAPPTNCTNECCSDEIGIRPTGYLAYNPDYIFKKWLAFWCGPWYSEMQTENTGGTNAGTATLFSSTVSIAYPNSTNVMIHDAEYWNTMGAECTFQPGCDEVDANGCPADFGVPNNSFGYKIPMQLPNQVNNNYVGLRSAAVDRRDQIIVKLTEPIAPCQYYIFECDAARMRNKSTQLKVRFTPDGDWSHNLTDQLGNYDHELNLENDPNSQSEWTHFTQIFEVDEASDETYLHIRISGPDLVFGHRMALVDNIKVYRLCQKRYDLSCMRDIGQPGLITVNNQHTSIAPLTFFNLENVEYVKIRISETDDGALIWEKSFHNPPSVVSWNGKNSNGSEVAAGYYIYNLNFDAGCLSCGDQISHIFSKGENSAQVFHALQTVQSGLLTFSNLSNVTQLFLRISNSSGIIREISIVNPQDVISWNGLDENGNQAPNGTYSWSLNLKNPCSAIEGEFLNGTYTKISPSPSINSNFNYNPIPKMINSNNCNYSFNYSAEAYSSESIPRECCELQPNISLSNIHLTGNLTIAAIGDIAFGPNVTIEPGTHITFVAQGEVTGADEFAPGDISEYDIIANPVYCPPQRIENPNLNYLSLPIRKNEKNKVPVSLLLFPNPTNESISFVVPDLPKVTYSIYSVLGTEVMKGNLTGIKGTVAIDVKSLSHGSYFILINEDKLNSKGTFLKN